MGAVFDRIRAAVAENRYVIGAHAGNQLDERGIANWQIPASLAEGRLLLERPRSRPNPIVEVEQLLPDGIAVKAVWSWLPYHDAAKLVTVHFLGR
jgi:hypothetical protein